MRDRILIVDDEKDVCMVLKENLEYEGYEVLTALTGEQALQRMRERAVSLVLVDLRLQGEVSGIQLIKESRDLSPRPKIVVISASQRKALEPIFKEEGVTDLIETVLEKPSDLTPEKVAETVNRILKHSQENIA